MEADSAVLSEPSDVIVPSVTTLPAQPTANMMVYLTQTEGANVPGLYLRSEAAVWILLSAGDAVT